MYHFQPFQLRVVRKHVRAEANRELFSSARFIILEHILATTHEFINHLADAGAEIFAIIAKPYSIDVGVLDSLKENHQVICESYETLESSDILITLIKDSIEKSMADHRPTLILDIGGYFARPLLELREHFPNIREHVLGVVEDTTFGHNRYMRNINDIPVPIYSVARSALKEIEARFVGRDAVTSMDMTLRNIGISISGRRALVLGYGMIGTNVARCLQANDLVVSVYDKYDHRNLQAFVDGFQIHKKRELLQQADIIFSATAQQALAYDEIEECRDNVILCSVGSKDTEFDVRAIKNNQVRNEVLGTHLVRYELPTSRHVIVAKEGAAVNFLLPSIPREILDLVFSEMSECFACLLRYTDKIQLGKIHVITEDCLSVLAKDWLIPMNL